MFLKKLLLTLFFVFFSTTSKGDVADLLKDKSKVVDIVKHLLDIRGYTILDSKIEIQYKPALIILVANTNYGKKFLKLHNRGMGTQEFEGGLLLSNHLPTIVGESLVASGDFDLLITPYFESIEEGGMLFDVINCLDIDKFAYHFDRMLKHVSSMVLSTLDFCKKPSLNDRLYYDRLKVRSEHQQSGRMEAFYETSFIELPGLRLPWNELILKKWVVDGVEYKESIQELIETAKNSLNPENVRFIALCHGDWHDMNIHARFSKDDLEDLVFLDCELSGNNCILGDAMVYLVYDAIQGDYLTPKYHSYQFENHQKALENAKSNFFLKNREISALLSGSTINLRGAGSFGTSPSRKMIAKRFVDKYFEPLIDECIKCTQGIPRHQIETTLKSCFLMRLLAVYNISTMEAIDQAKILSLLMKVVGTPVNKTPLPCLQTIIENL